MFRLAARSDTHEQAFVARYSALLGWAIKLTDGDRREAEDLVQDAFVRFVRVRPELAAITHLDTYLYSLVRNMHLSRIRRASARTAQRLSVVDYDSASLGLRSADAALLAQVRDELRGVPLCVSAAIVVQGGQHFPAALLPRVHAERNRAHRQDHAERRRRIPALGAP